MIEVRHVTKTFTKYEKDKGLLGMLKAFFNARKVITKAVDDISFSVKQGEVVGYIGANGAGKSTTIKMLTGIVTPTSGEILVNGLVPYQKRVENAKNIGVVFGQRTQLWWDLPLGESFSILKEIYEIPNDLYKQRLELFDSILDINSFIKSPVRTLSLGQRMRADIAASLLHNPKVLYLDEPTIGLDVSAKKKMREAIKKMNQEFNTTVILTTHDLDDIEELCQRIMIIDAGKIIYDGQLSEIKDKYGASRKIMFDLKNTWDPTIDLYSIFNVDQASMQMTYDENKLEISFDKHKMNVAQISQVILQLTEVNDLTILDADIETIVMQIYSEGKVTL
jgi:ABC-2 type transport system ATP-binding protein